MPVEGRGHGRDTFDDLPPGALIAAPVAIGLAAVALVPLCAAAVLLALARILGFGRVLLLGGAALGALLLIAQSPDDAWQRYAMAAPVWRIGDALDTLGLRAWLAAVVPVTAPLAFVAALVAEVYTDIRRPFWIEREPSTSVRRRLRARRDRRRLRHGAVNTPSGVALGTDERGGLVTLAEQELGQHALVLGATGSGKTTTLLQLARGLVARQRPLVVVDLKADPKLAASLCALADEHARAFERWSFDGQARWNPLAHGDATELMDKLVALEEWTEPHYKRAAQRYLSAALGALVTVGARRDLRRVIDLLNPPAFEALVDAERGRGLPEGEAKRLTDYLDALDGGTRSAVAGLANRLALLAESRAGRFLDDAPDAIDLRRSLREARVTLFSLDSQKYGETAGQMAALVAQDLKTVAAQRLRETEGQRPAYVLFDEFSAMGSDQVLGLLARARSAGIGAILATQELADLSRIDPGFEDQVLGNVAAILAHRQNVPESAERLAGVAGTRSAFEETWQTDRDRFARVGERTFGGWAGRNTGRGTIREVERYVVHPNAFKALGRGEAVLIRKYPRASAERVWIVVPEAAPRRHPSPVVDDREGLQPVTSMASPSESP